MNRQWHEANVAADRASLDLFRAALQSTLDSIAWHQQQLANLVEGVARERGYVAEAEKRLVESQQWLAEQVARELAAAESNPCVEP